MIVPEQRKVVAFMDASKSFLNDNRGDFSHILNDGIELFGVEARSIARELGIMTSTIARWRNKQSTPYAGMQHVVLMKLRALAPQYETHYDIVWAKSVDNKDRASYWHNRWLITFDNIGCWGLSGDVCWALINADSGTILESTVLSLLFACAREKILDAAADKLSEFQFEVS